MKDMASAKLVERRPSLHHRTRGARLGGFLFDGPLAEMSSTMERCQYHPQALRVRHPTSACLLVIGVKTTHSGVRAPAVRGSSSKSEGGRERFPRPPSVGSRFG